MWSHRPVNLREAFFKVTSDLPAVTSKANNTALSVFATTYPLAGDSGDNETAKLLSFLTLFFDWSGVFGCSGVFGSVVFPHSPRILHSKSSPLPFLSNPIALSAALKIKDLVAGVV